MQVKSGKKEQEVGRQDSTEAGKAEGEKRQSRAGARKSGYEMAEEKREDRWRKKCQVERTDNTARKTGVETSQWEGERDKGKGRGVSRDGRKQCEVDPPPKSPAASHTLTNLARCFTGRREHFSIGLLRSKMKADRH